MPAGGIVVLTGVGVASPTANVGTVVHTVSSNLGISTTADIIYAFEGASQAPTGFLTAITNAAVPNADSEIGNTGLTYGSSATALPSSTDGGRFIGARSGQVNFSNYWSLLGTVGVSTWETTTGDGSLYLPLNTNAFVTGSPPTVSISSAAIPEGNSGTPVLSLVVTRSDVTKA